MRKARFAALLLALTVSAPVTLADTPPSDQLPDDRVLYVAPGQGLSALVRRSYPDRSDDWAEIERWIVANNPAAFVEGDPQRLRAEVRLELPQASAFAARQSEATPVPDEGVEWTTELRFSDRYLFVDPAQSLRELVQAIYPEQEGEWGAIVEAVEARNADVLARASDAETIGRGTRLLIPDVVERPVTETQAEAPVPEPEPRVARLMEAEGRVTATDRAGRERDLNADDAVRRGDRLSTGPDAHAEIVFDDGERLFLRPDSRIRVREWRLPDVGPGTRVLELLAGGLRAITGAIGNREADEYQTVTPEATMGVRGTDYALRLCDSGGCRLGDETAAAVPAGLYAGVAQGEIELLNGAGESRYRAADYGYVADADSAPASADADVAGLLFTAAEREDLALGHDSAEPDDGESSSWWLWGTAGAVLLLAL